MTFFSQHADALIVGISILIGSGIISFVIYRVGKTHNYWMEEGMVMEMSEEIEPPDEDDRWRIGT